MEYSDYIAALRTSRAELAAELAPLRGLGGVMEWMRKRGIPLSQVEILQQDEFNLEFLFPLQPAGEHLVFGIT